MKVRIIIGPNGSGKTTFYHSLSNEFKLNVGLFINADIIEYQLKKNGSYVCKDLFNEQSEQELKLFLKNTTYNQKYDLSKSAKTVQVNDVDEEKIVSRFYKSLTNIKKVITKAHRVFIIDNSQEKNPEIIVELEKNKIQFLHSTYQPNWVLNLLK